jgi:long-chain acyl-CoA synthetase
MTENNIKTPWLVSKDPEVPAHLKYSTLTMAGAVEEIARKYPDYIAYEFQGRTTTYAEMWQKVEACARSLKAIGVREGDHVTICMPNAPQTVCAFYAVNLVGAIANMVHPLSAESEIAFYLRDSASVAAITLDQFYPKFENVRKAVDLPCLIVTSVRDELSPLMSLGYALTEGRKIAPVPKKPGTVMWKDFLRRGDHLEIFRAKRKDTDPAVTLYSGGTTGVTKGILLSNRNFNALGAQIVATNPFFKPGCKMLAIMPMFHGFGLGVSIHSMLVNGGHCILIPRFTPKSFAEMLKKYRPNLIAGVPSLFEALLRVKEIEDADLSCLQGVFSGGDSLSIELKKRFDKFLEEHGATVHVREGYGATECVTASCLTPMHKEVEGSIGIPFPDTYYKIVKPDTEEEVPYGEEGEICIAGPTVMLEYVNQPEETAHTLRVHADGLTWVHTGDLGMMDEAGFVYFRQRIKRMIVTNGYNVYPSQLENILDGHEYVHMSCVIGVPDPIKIQKVKAFIMLKPGYVGTSACKAELMDYCRKHIAKYALPYDLEFREDLPKTLVGKVAYRKLEEEELAKMKEQEAKDAEVEQIRQSREAEEARLAAEAAEKKKAKAAKMAKEGKAPEETDSKE